MLNGYIVHVANNNWGKQVLSLKKNIYYQKYQATNFLVININTNESV